MSNTGGPISTGSGSVIEGMTGGSGQLTEQALFDEIDSSVIYFGFSRFSKLAEKINYKSFYLFGLSKLKEQWADE